MNTDTDRDQPTPYINYGARLRIGMLIPSANTIAEPQVRAMLPDGVAVNFTRLPLRGSSVGDLMGMIENIEPAASLLADAAVDLIAFNCTAVSTYSPDLEKEICSRIEQATGIAAITTGQALLEALRTLGARKVTLLTPYTDEINAREADFFKTGLVEVIRSAGLSLNTPAEMASVPKDAWLKLANELHTAQSEALVISCTAVRSAEIIGLLERQINCPVITSNQALTWHCLRLKGIQDSVVGFGTLLSDR